MDGETCFVLSHGRPYRTDGAVSKSYDESRVSYRPQQHDVVKYDNRNGQLKVQASNQATINQYRTAFGEHLFKDSAFFGDDSVVTLEPLISKGRSVLEPTPGIKEVHLTAIKLKMDNDLGTTVSLESNDVFADLEAHPTIDPKSGELVYARLMVRYDSGGRMRKIELKPSNQAIFNRSKEEHLTLLYLKSHGFYMPPKPDESPEP